MPNEEVIWQFDDDPVRETALLYDDSDDGLPFGLRAGSQRMDVPLWLEASEAKALADAIYERLPDQTLAPQGSYVEAVLTLAATHGKTVKFGYAKGNGDYIENRRLIPGKVEVAKNGYTIVVGHDPDRDDVRAYRVDRIKGQVSLV